MSKSKLGTQLRELRKQQKLPLRKVAADLDIDVAILSKMERGERKLTKSILIKLADIYKQDPDNLMVQYLSEKVLDEIRHESLAAQAMIVAEASVAYTINQKENRTQLIEKMVSFFEKDKRVTAAWIFGSFARDEMTNKSDIDLMVRFDPSQRISLFDIADIAYQLELINHRRIDLVEEGTIQSFAEKSIRKDLLKIYG